MRDEDKTKKQLISELELLRARAYQNERHQMSFSNRPSWLEAEDLYLSLIAEALFGYYVVQDGKFLFINPKLAEIFGYHFEDMLNSVAPLDIVHPDNLTPASEHLQLKHKGQIELGVNTLKGLKKDGTTLYLQVTSSHITYRGRAAIHGNVLDMTERRLIEQQLRESESRYRAIVEDQTELITRFQADGTVTFANEAYRRYYGIDISEIIGKDVFPPSWTGPRNKFKQLVSHLNQDTPSGKFEYSFETQRGTTRWLQWTIRALYDNRDTIIEYQGVGRDITKDKQAEQSLLQGEIHLKKQLEYLNTLIENLNELFFTYDLNGNITFINRKCQEVLGYLPSDMIGHCLYEFVPEKYYATLEKGMRFILDQGGSVSAENPVLCKGGTIRIIKLNSAPIIEEGIITGAMVAAEDVTERKAIDEALRKSQSNLQSRVNYLNTIIDNLNEIFYTYDRNARITFINQKSWDVLGYKPEELLGTDIMNLAVPEHRDVIWKEIQDRLTKGHSSSYELPIHHRNGTRLLLQLNASPIFEGDEVVGGMALAQDISERKRIEHAIAEEKERLAVTLRSIGEGVITTDTSGHINLLNETAEKLLGRPQADILGQPIYEFFNVIDPVTREPYPLNPMEELQNLSTLKLGNLILLDRSGLERTIDATAARIRDGLGKFIGVVLVFRDITERIRMEEELLKTTKLESVGVLAGGIAHDFNNLLTVIMGNVSLAKMTLGENASAQALLSKSERASLQAKALTQQLLTFARGAPPLKKTVSLGMILADSLNLTLSGSNVRRELVLEDDLWLVDADEGQIAQVFNNLIINAIQAMPKGGTVTLRAENVSIDESMGLPLTQGRYVRIVVSDEGEGIPESHYNRIFDPYFTTKPTGSGLGLATAYAIIKNHSGLIRVDSPSENGTSFAVYLPASKNLSKKEAPDMGSATNGKGRILVMDDEEGIRDVVAHMLRAIGYDPTLAADGKEAIDLYSLAMDCDAKYDALIMDLTVPGGLGGKEALQILLQIDPQVKAIVSSGYSNDLVVADYRDWGFLGFVPKPFSIADLGEALNDLLAP